MTEHFDIIERLIICIYYKIVQIVPKNKNKNVSTPRLYTNYSSTVLSKLLSCSYTVDEMQQISWASLISSFTARMITIVVEHVDVNVSHWYTVYIVCNYAKLIVLSSSSNQACYLYVQDSVSPYIRDDYQLVPAINYCYQVHSHVLCREPTLALARLQLVTSFIRPAASDR